MPDEKSGLLTYPGNKGGHGKHAAYAFHVLLLLSAPVHVSDKVREAKRAAVIVTLIDAAAEFQEHIPLHRCLYEFRDHTQVQAVCHRDDARQDILRPSVIGKLGYQLAVQLHFVEDPFLQIQDRIMPHAEVIEAEADSAAFEAAHILHQRIGDDHCGALCNLHYRMDTFQIITLYDTEQFIEEAILLHLLRRDVDRQIQVIR